MCVPGCEQVVHRALSRRGFLHGTGAAVFAASASSLAQAQAPASFRAVVDLTHTMSPDFPTFFGVPGIEMQKQFDIKKDGFNLYWWRLIEHAGTHLDAPIHFSENGATADRLDAANPGVPRGLIDCADQAGRGSGRPVSAQELRGWEAKNGRLPDGCCV